MTNEVKQVILIRTDLKMGKGKIAAQVAHASLSAYKNAPKKLKEEWERTGMKKVVLKVESEDELLDFQRICNTEGFPCSLIRDAGHTQIEPGSITSLGAGPYDENALDRVFGKLKLL
ncbi:peptidyl-tRNA hydrolase Pth2 [Candidatus Micrarchaeota archaeon]|nr:peptidyl-tRNA hydrolase Pth2 [Candidatus Micrarchaeota archaeon]